VPDIDGAIRTQKKPQGSKPRGLCALIENQGIIISMERLATLTQQ